MLCTVALLALFASVQGRAVNISNTWVLPEEGFPVFYRYFRDRISWYEADAVCQFHHANLVTVDTTAQYDAVRAYLKELDISSAVWVGLIRSNPEGDFTWTDYHGLSGDGYWSSAPDSHVAPLCAAADPTSDYRWKARSCGGPTVASFICELPVPQWALGNEGCMVRALPALTVLYLPESASVQLTADCGLAGVKRIQCTGNVKRPDLLRDLSCTEEEEITTTASITTSGTTWSTTIDSVFTDQQTTAEITNEYNVTIEQERDNNQHSTKPPSYTSVSLNVSPEYNPSVKALNTTKFNSTTEIVLKHLELNLYKDMNNLHSNHIPKIAYVDAILSNEQLDKIEDEKHMQHKMLHEEIARQGNLENIFTQPTDHFVPPLVMAKAKISNDMTVLSLQEKHAQQMAEHHLLQEKPLYYNYTKTNNITYTTIIEQPKITLQSIKSKNYTKKDKNKTTMPKKYIEKVFDPKSSSQKTVDTKLSNFEKVTDPVTSTETLIKYITTTRLPLVGKLDEDDFLNLTVLLKDAPDMQEEKPFYNYSGDISRLEAMNNYTTQNNETEIKFYDFEATEQTKQENLGIHYQKNIKNITHSHSITETTGLSDLHNFTVPQVFEMTTKMPIQTPTTTSDPIVKSVTNSKTITNATTLILIEQTTSKSFQTDPIIDIISNMAESNYGNDTADIIQNISALTNPIITAMTELPVATSTSTVINNTMSMEEAKPTDNTQSTHAESTTNLKTDFQEEFEANSNNTDKIDDYNSSLLSGANIPPHRPNRSRRLQSQPSRNKFNPFRILG